MAGTSRMSEAENAIVSNPRNNLLVMTLLSTAAPLRYTTVESPQSLAHGCDVLNETAATTYASVQQLSAGPVRWAERPYANYSHGLRDEGRQQAIRSEFIWSWSAYEQHAYGRDELNPLSQRGQDWIAAGPLGITLLDSLDSLVILGLHDEYIRALKWVNQSLNFHLDGAVSTFETTIRALGGLLSAHALTREPILLDRATELGYRLLHAFETPTGLPTTKVDAICTPCSFTPCMCRAHAVHVSCSQPWFRATRMPCVLPAHTTQTLRTSHEHPTPVLLW